MRTKMKSLLKSLLLSTLLVQVVFSRKYRPKDVNVESASSEEDDDYEEAALEDGGAPEGGGEDEDIPAVIAGQCSDVINLEVTQAVRISGGTQRNCTFMILATDLCEPRLQCAELQLDGEKGKCGSTYLEVSDGWGGNHRFCGKEKFPKKGVKASKGARDLVVTIQGHPGGKVQCQASCNKAGSRPDLLGKAKRRKIDRRCVCGIQNLDDRIVGGEDAKKFEFPWQGAIVPYGTREPFCGCSLINDRFILTAAHCFLSGNDPKDFQVLLHAHLLDATVDQAAIDAGEADASIHGAGWDDKSLSDEDERTIRLDIEEIYEHPFFNGDEFDFDVALLRLRKPVDLSSIEATPVCLPPIGDRRHFLNAMAKVIGWGKPSDQSGTTTRRLQKLDVPVIEPEECKREMGEEGFPLTERMMCAGYPEGKRDSCTGDSGGPLIVKQENEQFMQIGVVSWGVGCAIKDRPGVYTRITQVADWMQYHIRKHNAIWCRESVDEIE